MPLEMRSRSAAMGGAAACVLLCGSALFLVACEKKAAFAPPPPKVTVNQPLQQNVTDYLEFTGNTQAINTVQLRARVEGYLEKILFKDGETVKKDQLLFVIQQNTYVARLQQAEGNVLSQKALLEHAQTEFARYTALLGQKAASQTDVENWRYQRESAQAALKTAEAQRDLARLDLGYTSVTAPFTGRIDRRLADPGNLVGSGAASVLAEMTQIDPLYVYFNISESDIASLAAGSTVASVKEKAANHPVHLGFVGEEGYPHAGYIDFSATTVSTTTGTLLMRGVFPNPDGKMLPGQFARVKVPVGKERSVLLVPKVAVAFDQQGTYVMLVNGNNVVERRGVKTGSARGELFVIEEGLTGTESVVVKGLLKSIPGRTVTPEREPSAKQLSGTDQSHNTEAKAAK